MYSNEYEDEKEEQENDNGSFLSNFYNNNKVLVWIAIGIIIFLIVMSLLTKGGSSEPTNVSYDVTIYPEGEAVITLGNSKKLIPIVKDIANPTIKWSSENEAVATVDDGTVKAVGYGKTVIVATYIHTDNKEYKGTKEIVVADGVKDVQLTGVTFKEGDLLMPANSEYKIGLLLNPSNAYVTDKTFKSSNEKVATVDNTGKVESLQEGETTISFSVNNNEFSGSLNVYVSDAYTRAEIIKMPTEINIDGELRKIKKGASEKLTVRTVPENVDQTKFTWSSNDESILTVDNYGRITGVKEGRAQVTVKAINGKSASIDIEVEKDIVEVTDIMLSVDSVTLMVGQTQTITPIVSPSDASNKMLMFDSMNTAVASVSPNATGTSAVITGNSSGSTEIVISSTNNVKKKINVQVTGGSNGGSSGGNSGGSSGGSSSSGGSTTIVVRIIDDSGNEIVPVKTCTSSIQITNPARVKVTIHDGLKYIKWCVAKASSKCNPNNQASAGTKYIDVPSGGLYLLRIQKYDKNGSEVGPSGDASYVDGALEYYINTSSSTSVNCAKGSASGSSTVTSGFHTVTNAYTTPTKALDKAKTSNSVTFKVSDSNGGYIRYCIYKGGECNPFNGIKVTSSGTSSTYTASGLYYVGVNEYDKDGLKIGSTKYYYFQINNSSTPTPSTQPNVTTTPKPVTPAPQPTPTKPLSSLTFKCDRGELEIYDGSVTLEWSDYCTREYRSSANYDRYSYTCTGKGIYTGTKTHSCNVAF